MDVRHVYRAPLRDIRAVAIESAHDSCLRDTLPLTGSAAHVRRPVLSIRTLAHRIAELHT